MVVEAEFRALMERARKLDEEEFVRLLLKLPAPVRRRLEEDWYWRAHRGQREPETDWRVWLMMAGRGFGKTRAGAEWVWTRVRSRESDTFAGSQGEEGGILRVALAGANMDDVEKVMVRGESGLMAAARPDEEVRWVASRQMAVFSSGHRRLAEGYAYSGEKPDKLRGPQHHFAWCDELAKWSRGQAAWDNLMLGLRLGERPRTMVTTTPKPIPLLKRIEKLERCAVTRGRTGDNRHLPEDYVAAVTAMYAGTRLGRQELEGELIEDLEGALFPIELIEASRCVPAARELAPTVVVGVDPPASTGGTCGIVACGLGRDGIGYVLGDHSIGGVSPEGWARKVAWAAETYRAARVVAEANNGGHMVESVLKGAGLRLPLKLVHASEGKAARAAPVAVLFESGRAKLAGRFPALEEELAGLAWGKDYEGPGTSPDRADACVWALTELLLGETRVPRIVTF